MKKRKSKTTSETPTETKTGPYRNIDEAKKH